MVRVLIYLLMEMFLRVCTIMENLLDKVSTNGKMEAFTLELFRMVSNMARVSGVSVSTPKTATCMRETTQMTRRMEWVFSCGRVGTTTRAAIKMTRGTDTERCTGRTAHVIRVSGHMVYSMEWVGWSSQMAESRKEFSRTITLRHLNSEHPKLSS